MHILNFNMLCVVLIISGNNYIKSETSNWNENKRLDSPEMPYEMKKRPQTQDKLQTSQETNENHQFPPRKHAPYAIVYGNGRPIGILQPFQTFFDFFSPSRYSGANIRKERKVNILKPSSYQDEEAKYTDERYPHIFTNFRIRNRLKMRKNKLVNPLETKTIEKPLLDEDSLKIVGLQAEQQEDEDLESGANRIDMVRERREDDKSAFRSDNEEESKNIDVRTKREGSFDLKSSSLKSVTTNVEFKEGEEEEENICSNIRNAIKEIKEKIKRSLENKHERNKRKVCTSLNEENNNLNPCNTQEIFLTPLKRRRRKVITDINVSATSKVPFEFSREKRELNYGFRKVEDPYSEEDEEIDDEGDEFDDDSFDDKTTNLRESDEDYEMYDADPQIVDNFDDNPESEDFEKLDDMSGKELFGALPLGYQGELSRYKRVKRRSQKGLGSF